MKYGFFPFAAAAALIAGLALLPKITSADSQTAAQSEPNRSPAILGPPVVVEPSQAETYYYLDYSDEIPLETTEPGDAAGSPDPAGASGDQR